MQKNIMQTLRKIFAAGVIFVTVLSMTVTVAPAKAAASAGDLIKMNGLSSVYYLAADGKRYVFPNESTYFSWYSDFSTVMTVPQSELEGYALGANVTVRPGTKLVKITTNPKVYAVEPGGSLVAIPDEATAKTLFGDNWAKRVVDIADAFFTNYKISSKVLTATAYPVGSLIKTATDPAVYYIDTDGKARKVATEAAFNANRFSFNDVITTTVALPALGADVTAVIPAVVDTASGAGGSIGAGSGLTVSLSGLTPASASIIQGQALANIAAFNLTAANDGAVKLTQIKVKRVGISSDNTLSNVYLYDGNTRLTDAASVSSNYITWNNSAGIISIPAGQTKTLTVKASVATAPNAVSGETVGVQVVAASDVTTDGASVTGSFPVSGNLMSVAAATLATVSFGTNLVATNNAVNPGETGYSVWKVNAAVSGHDVNLKYLTLRMIGSAAYADIKNLTLFVDNVKAGNAVALTADGYATFDLSAAPVKMLQGTKTLDVRGDIIDGSSKNYKFQLQYAIDVLVEDDQYGVPVTVTGTVPNTGGTQTVSSGSMTVVKATDSASGNVTLQANGVSLGKFTLTAYGENIKVENLAVGVVTAGQNNVGSVRNGRLFVDGVQVGSTANIAANGTIGAATTSFTTNFIVNVGKPATLEVKADVYDADGIQHLTATSSLKAVVLGGNANGRRQTTLDYIDVPTAPQAGNQLQVVTGTAVLSAQGNYGTQTVVLPQTAYKIGAFNLSGNTTEDINVNNIQVDITEVTNATFNEADITDMYVKYGTAVTSIKPTVGATNNFSLSYTLAKNTSVPVEVYATLNGSAVTSGDSFRTVLTATGLTAGSAQAITAGPINGQEVKSGTGSITVAKDASSPAAALVAAKGTNQVKAAAFKFTTSNNSFSVDEMYFTVVNGTPVISLEIKDGATTVATLPLVGNGATSTSAVSIGAGVSKTLDVYLNMGTVGSSAGQTGGEVTVTLAGYKTTGTGQSQSAYTAAGISGNRMVAYKATPTITAQTLASSVLSGGTKELAKFTVAADGGELAWNRLYFTFATSSANITNISNVKVYDEAGTEVTASSTGTVFAFDTKTFVFVPAVEQTVGTSKTYTVRGTVTVTGTGSDSLTFDMAMAQTAPAASAVYGGVTGNSGIIWSDESSDAHSLFTADWAGDYLVKSLPLSWTLSK